MEMSVEVPIWLIMKRKPRQLFKLTQAYRLNPDKYGIIAITDMQNWIFENLMLSRLFDEIRVFEK